jgi:hypothetical protein
VGVFLTSYGRRAKNSLCIGYGGNAKGDVNDICLPKYIKLQASTTYLSEDNK